jgi:AcrR family transcriptional regulator
MAELTPRQRRRQRTKRAILKTARELVAEKGPEGLSIREIARRIDYSPAGLYEYYESKDEIVAAICSEGMERLSASFNNIPANLSLVQQLIEMGLAYVDFAVHNAEQFLLIFNSLPSKRFFLDEPVADNSPYGILLQTVQAAIEAGEFNVTDEYAAEGIAYSLWALMHGRAMLQLTFLRNFQTDFDALHRWAIEMFIKGLKAD